jgi:hypothetical protein
MGSNREHRDHGAGRDRHRLDAYGMAVGSPGTYQLSEVSMTINLDKLERIAHAASIFSGLEAMARFEAEIEFDRTFRPDGVLELCAEVRRLREGLREALLDAERAREERNRVGVETRREWMAKCEVLRVERGALLTACRNAILPLACAALQDSKYQRAYELLSAAIDRARTKAQS